ADVPAPDLHRHRKTDARSTGAAADRRDPALPASVSEAAAEPVALTGSRLASRNIGVAAGAATFVLVTAAVMLAWPGSSPLVPRHGGHPTGDRAWAWAFLGLLIAAFCVYVVAVAFVRAAPPRVGPVAVLACVIQLVPLGAPLL